MQKKLAEYFGQYNMQIVKNHAYGTIKGYETNVDVDNYAMNISGSYPLSIHISFFGNDEQRLNIENTLKLANIKICNIKFTKYGVLLNLTDITFKKLVVKITMLLDLLFNLLAENNALGVDYCPVCGNKFYDEKTKIFKANDMTIKIDDDCVEQLNELIEQENKEFKESPNNYVRGFLGALIGGVVGGVIAFIVYLIGFISAWSAIIAVLLGAFLYGKFKGKQNKIMILILTITTLVCMLGSLFAIYLYISQGAAIEAGFNITVFEAFSKLMENSEFSNALIYDFTLTFVFSLIGIVIVSVSLFKKIKREKGLKEIQSSIK